MPETRVNGAAVVSRRALRIVLLGPPGAGKTSLLGALALAAEQQGPEARWTLTDLSQRLTELRQRIEQDQPQSTIAPDQVVTYPIRFEQRASKGGRPQRFDACLLDCDSDTVQQLLSGDAGLVAGSLVDALLQADAVVLTLPVVQADVLSGAYAEGHKQLWDFLQYLEEERGEEIRASGLPVVPVLTKCDLLAQPGDTFADWVDRVQQHRQQLEQCWHQRWTVRPATDTAFGQIQLQPMLATAIRRPPLMGQAADVVRVYGVADLLQFCLNQASRYRRRQWRSTRRMLLLSCTLVLVLLGMILFGLLQGGVRTIADRLALEAAVQHETDRYHQLRRRALALEEFADLPLVGGAGVPWATWDQHVEELLAEARVPRPAVNVLLPGADTVTYEAVFQNEEVRQARLQYEAAAEQLLQRRNLVTALGLVTQRTDRPALLKIPPPPEFSVAQASARLEMLARVYPDYGEWSLDRMPRLVAQELTAALQMSERNLLAAGQHEILRQLQWLSPDGRETPELWQQLRIWLDHPVELGAWRELVRVIIQLSDPRAEDPVLLLRHFLDKPQHHLEWQRLVLKLPMNLAVVPAGKLAIHHSPGTANAPTTLLFQQWGEPLDDPDEKTVRYTFVPEAGETATYRLTYRPGELLWANLPLRTSDKQPRQFTWSLCRSQVFQFERLIRPPRLHRPDQVATAGELILEAGLTVPVGIVPRMPDLIPVVKLQRRE